MEATVSVLSSSLKSAGSTSVRPADNIALLPETGLGVESGRSWSAISATIGQPPRGLNNLAKTGVEAGFSQLTSLLRLQSELQRYQLRVEVVSKVAESAVASLRKLQQQ